MIDPELLKYATPKQAEKLQAVIDHRTYRGAAKVLNCSYSTIQSTVERVKKNAVKRGYIPEIELKTPLPEGVSLERVTNHYHKGELVDQWPRYTVDKAKQEELLRTVADTLADDVAGKSIIVKLPKTNDKDIMAGYPLPEPHFGMFSWGKETGQDYDCSEASKIILKSMAQLVESAPNAETAIISDIGDWFHTDTTNNTTAKAGNQLDVDSRWPRVVQIGVKVFIQVANMALTKHKLLHIKGVGGNHSPHTSYMIALILDAYFRNNDRVVVDLSPNPYKFHKFGKNLIGINHGDMGKPAELPMVMAEDCQDWSATKFRVWWTGHVHHLTKKEFPGCVVETFRSVAAKDSWHHQSGYRAGRDAVCIVFHKDRGEVQRITVAV